MKNKIPILLLYFSSLFFQQQLSADPPDWSVHSPDFAYSSNITAVLEIDHAPNNAPDNIIGFMVNGEVRAVASATMLGNEAYYFITVFSNVISGETMDILVYVAAEDLIYTATESYEFVSNQIVGSPDHPHTIEVDTDGDYPISLEDIPEQFTRQQHGFATIDLADYLIQEDDDFINWSYEVNAQLNIDLNGSLLTATPVDPEWVGSTSLNIQAQEITGVPYTANTSIVFTVEEGFTEPAWEAEGIPDQTIPPNETFSAFNLNDYEYAYDGSCLEFSISPVLEVPEDWVNPPAWTVHPPDFQYSMSITAKVRFTEHYFYQNSGDLLGAFANDEVRGVAAPHFAQNGEVLYFLTIYGDVNNEPIQLKFYSQEYRVIYEIPLTFPFQVNQVIGTPDVPQILDVAPIDISLSPSGDVTVNILNDNWLGSQPFEFGAADCDYPETTTYTYATFTVTDGPLAIELINFSGEAITGKGNLLNWTIRPTQNLEQFIIQRSHSPHDDFLWKNIGIINAENGQVNFSFWDQEPLGGKNYYRLRLQGKSGQVTHSDIISINNKPTKAFTLFPNPVSHQVVWLTALTASQKPYQVVIYGANGQLVFFKVISIEEGQLDYRLALPELGKGIYWLRLESREEVKTRKLVVQ